mmetsp:Transcript_7202/g.8268  ORF Transcript_7202/g.8268 Transcript_7202/m.8268 type:complete len:228 (+) Transcript_7202:173-856(+)
MEKFVSISLQHYLYSRQVYPSQIFKTEMHYNCLVFLSRHEDLTKYIEDHTRHVFGWAKQGKVETFTVCLREEGSARVVERLVYKIEKVIQPSALVDNFENIQIEKRCSVLLRFGRINSDLPLDSTSPLTFTLLVYPDDEAVGSKIFPENVKKPDQKSVLSQWMSAEANMLECTSTGQTYSPTQNVSCPSEMESSPVKRLFPMGKLVFNETEYGRSQFIVQIFIERFI